MNRNEVDTEGYNCPRYLLNKVRKVSVIEEISLLTLVFLPPIIFLTILIN